MDPEESPRLWGGLTPSLPKGNFGPVAMLRKAIAMSDPADSPVKSDEPTLCAVCAWRKDCKKKFSYDQGGPVKCPDFTRDEFLKPENSPDKK